MPKKIPRTPLVLFNFFLFASFLLLSILWLMIKLEVANELNPSLSFFAYLDIIRSHAGLDLALCGIFALNFALSLNSKIKNRLKNIRSTLAILLYIFIVFYFLKLTGLYAYTHDATPNSMIEYGTYLLSLPFAGEALSFIGYTFLPCFIFFSLLFAIFLTITPLEKYQRIKYYQYFMLIIGLIFISAIPPIQKNLSLSIAYHPYIYSAFASRETSSASLSSQKNLQKNARNQPTDELPHTQKNIVIVVLESFGASTIQKDITPNLYQLKLNSLNFENTYSVIPHTSKALVTIHCGDIPYLSPYLLESNLGTRSDCLATELKNEGYQTVFFQSVTQYFENRKALVKQLGFDEFIPLESMDKTSFEAVNYFGYEDDIMLPVSKEWLLKKDSKKPFLASYLTGTSHHNYHTPSSFPNQNFVTQKNKNRYLNASHYVDRFVGKLIQQYKELGLYENTIFVFVGDHGEGFGDHRPLMHNNNLYNSGIKIPLIIHDASREPSHSSIEKLSSQSEIKFFIETLLRKNTIQTDSNEKSIVSSCWYPNFCYSLVEQQGVSSYKFILDMANNTRELYDLSQDPDELINLSHSKIELSNNLEKKLLDKITKHKNAYNDYYNNTYDNFLDSKINSFSTFKTVTQD